VAILGALLMLALGWHAALAYASIAGIEAAAGIHTPDALSLFDDLTTGGIRVPNGTDARNRQALTGALEQFELDGTGVCLSFVMVVGGAFVGLQQHGRRP
jgi:hypothetical protein